MKKFMLASWLLFSLLMGNAQRVDLDRFNFSVSFRNFPSDPLPEAYKTYNVRVESASSMGLGQGLENAIVIEGLKKVSGTGHVTVLAMLDDIVIDKTETTERIEIKKDKQGNEIRTPHYATQMTYSFSARASVYDYKGNTLLSNYRLYNRDDKKTYRTSEFNSSADAANYFNNKVGEIQQNLASQLIGAALSNLNGMLNERFGYGVQKVNDILWILNNRRHAEYDGHQKAWNNFRNAIVLMNADEPLDKVREKMQPVIDYFEKIKTRFTSSSKEDRKMRYASYFNLSKIYLYLDEPEKAIREADALSMNDFDEKDGRYLRAAAENLNAVFRKNNANTRHFPIDIASYEPPVK